MPRASSRKKARGRTPARPARKTPAPKAQSAGTGSLVSRPPAPAKSARPAPTAKPAGPARPAAPAKSATAAKSPAPARSTPTATDAHGKTPRPSGARKSARKPFSQRRGPDGELLAPGELLLPGGTQTAEEVQYLFRGCVAAEHPVPQEGIAEVILKRNPPDPGAAQVELARQMQAVEKRFASGSIEPMLPSRPAATRRNFHGVVERARLRRREIGAFLRGLHLGRLETSHMDSHGEDSLQKLMEWAARLENLMESEEPEHADYVQFHRGLDHLENTTEAFVVDVEATLRRLRDRVRASR